MLESDRPNSQKIQYNSMLIKGYQSFQNKDIQAALFHYQDALKMSTQPTSSALIKSIIGVLHMHNCNYSEAVNTFIDGIKHIQPAYTEKSQISYENASVLIKLFANLSMCYLVLGKHNESIESLNTCLSTIRKCSKSNVVDLFESLMYIFYRFTSFSAIKATNFQNSEFKYDDVTQACFYSTMAINKQLCSNNQQAFQLQKRAYQLWQSRKEYGFMLISVRHLLHLSQQMNLRREAAEYDKLLQNILQHQQMFGISDKTLFKGYNDKLDTAKAITNILMNFQNNQVQAQSAILEVKGWKEATRLKLIRAINSAKSALPQESGRSRQQLASAIEQMQQTLRSLDSEKNSLVLKNLQKSKYVVDAVNYLKAQIHRISKYCQKSKITLQKGLFDKWREKNYRLREQDRILEKNSKVGSYLSAESKDHKPNSVVAVPNQPTVYYDNTDRIPSYVSQPNQMSQIPPLPPPQTKYNSRYDSQNNRPGDFGSKMSKQPSVSPVGRDESPLNRSRLNRTNGSFIYFAGDEMTNAKVQKCIKVCEMGQFFIKRNFTSNGGDEKFIKLTKTDIRWAATEEKITKKDKFQSYLLSDIRGVVYGKVTPTMRKSSNKQLLPWMCFSIAMQKRTLDICCTEEVDINYWVPGLSAAIQRANQNKLLFGYSPGKTLWVKLFLKVNYHFIDNVKEKRKHQIPFAVALTRYIKNGCKLPKS